MMGSSGYPAWLVLNIPQDSTHIPAEVRDQFLLDDGALALELQQMTDHFTHRLFAEPSCGDATVVRAPVSRLVVDVERFANDSLEPMAARGMGAVYEATSQLAPLRRPLLAGEREALMRLWYDPHQAHLEAAVSLALERHGRCVVLDAHSFPGHALPYEVADAGSVRPDICIGSDPYHTPTALEQAFVDAFASADWPVVANDPFSGAMVPTSRYRSDPRVHAVTVEVNRNCYLDPVSFEPSQQFEWVASEVRTCCIAALRVYASDYRMP